MSDQVGPDGNVLSINDGHLVEGSPGKGPTAVPLMIVGDRVLYGMRFNGVDQWLKSPESRDPRRLVIVGDNYEIGTGDQLKSPEPKR